MLDLSGLVKVVYIAKDQVIVYEICSVLCNTRIRRWRKRSGEKISRDWSGARVGDVKGHKVWFEDIVGGTLWEYEECGRGHCCYIEWVVDVQGAALCSPILQLQPRREGLNRKQDVTGSEDYAGSVCGRMCWHNMGCALYAATGARGSFLFFYFLFYFESRNSHARGLGGDGGG